MRFSTLIIILTASFGFFVNESKCETFISSSEEKSAMSDSLKSSDYQTGIGRLISSIYQNAKTDRYFRNNDVVTEMLQRNYLAQFEGYRIRNIIVLPQQITEANTWVARTANKLHVTSRENTIRKDLLFKLEDKLDPDVILVNSRLLRSRTYISDVTIIVVPIDAEPGTVEILVITRDSWTISADANLTSNREPFISIFDDNLFGHGNALSITTSYNFRNGHYGGNKVEYISPNMFGTFFSGRFVAGKGFYHYDYGAEIEKEFLLTRDYAGGASFLHKKEDIFMFQDNDSIQVNYNTYDLWYGKSWRLPKFGNSIFITSRLAGYKFTDRPSNVSANRDPYFHNRNTLLSSVGVYRERIRAANLVYGYGVTEYIAHGYRAGFTGGYSWEEFGNRWYMGANLDAGVFTKGGYLGWKFGISSFLNSRNGKFYRTTLAADFNYFSNLFGNGRYKYRQFVNINMIRGWNRLEGYREFVKVNRAEELRGLGHNLYGANKMTVNSETVMFTPWDISEFKFAMFGFVDLGLVGPHGNFFRNDFYSTVGIGVRIKNESLVFNTISIRLGVALNKNGFMDSQYIAFERKNRMAQIGYTPYKASIQEYQ